MTKKKQKETPRIAIDIKEIEAQLPKKRSRSHKVVVKLDHVFKSFKKRRQTISVIKNINLNLYSGEFVIVYGPSGCGKSTFLHTVLGLERPSRGHVYLRDTDLYKMTNDERTNFRREKIGMVFQQSNWIKALTALENVAYPLFLAGYQEQEAKAKALKALKEIELEKYANYRPAELSGGQQQRVALARALSTDPWIIIADEPTGNLDTKSGQDMMVLLAKLNREKRRMIIMVTHDMNFLPLATRRIGMKDGRVIFDAHD